MRSESVKEKGRRLANAGRVTHDDGAQVYLVRGDHATYAVVVFSTGDPFCTCRAFGACSHVHAVARARVREAQSA